MKGKGQGRGVERLEAHAALRQTNKQADET